MNNCLGKLFTSILNNRLKDFILDQDVLHKAQRGFLPGHRTSDHIFTLRTMIDKYVKNVPKGKLYTCFIDFKKAFDSIWHDGLFYKLLHYNIGGKFYNLVKSLYSKTKCSIKFATNTRTEFLDYCKGVRQGCILSPMLFNLYLNDIPFLLDREDTHPIVLSDGTRMNCLLYADDFSLTLFYSPFFYMALKYGAFMRKTISTSGKETKLKNMHWELISGAQMLQLEMNSVDYH